MENFGTLQIQSTLRFYDSLRRHLKLNKKPFEISDGFCDFDTVTQPRQLNKRRGARGHTCVHQHSNNRASKFRGQGRRVVIKLPLLCLENVSKKKRTKILHELDFHRVTFITHYFQ